MTEEQRPSHDESELEKLLGELSFNPVDLDRSAQSTPHQAPLGLSQRVLAALPEQQIPASGLGRNAFERYFDPIFGWFGSPLRALCTAAMPLVLGVVIGAVVQPQTSYLFTDTDVYPDDDNMLVLASLSDDFGVDLGPALEDGDFGVEVFSTEEGVTP